MNFEQLKVAIQKHQRRTSRSTYLDAKGEVAENLYPLLERIVDEVDERLGEVEASVEALIEQTMSIIQPDLAAQILMVFGLANDLANAVENGTDTKNIILALREASHVAETAVIESTVEDDEDEEGEGGEEEEPGEETAEETAAEPEEQK